MLRPLVALALLLSFTAAVAAEPLPPEPLCEAHYDFHGRGGWLSPGDEVRMGGANYDWSRDRPVHLPREGTYRVLTAGAVAWTLYSDDEATRGQVLAQGVATPDTPVVGMRDMEVPKLCLVLVNIGPPTVFDAEVS